MPSPTGFDLDNKINSSDDEDIEGDDADTCGYGEIQSQFKKWTIFDEKFVLKKESFVTHMDTDRLFKKLAVGTSANTFHLFNTSDNKLVHERDLNVDTIETQSSCGVAFSKEDENVLYVGSSQGDIVAIDLRNYENIYTMSEPIENKKLPFSCFDVNSNGRILCAGSDKVLNDAFLVFFDTRQRKSLGTYYESHENDLTSVQFHPSNSDCLLSGSIDGLINIFDISKNSEYDAITTIINTESSVSKLKWHPKGDNKYVISCITHTEDLKLYDSEEGDLITEYTRSNIAESIRRKSPSFCSLISCHSKDTDIVLLAGSDYKDKSLRSLIVGSDGLQQYANYEGNKQIIRESIFNAQANVLLTAGEGACIDLWREIPAAEKRVTLKEKTSLKSTRHKDNKPY